MEQIQTLEQAQAEIAALRLKLAQGTRAKNQLVSITDKGTHIMVRRAGKGWPILGTPEDFAIVLANAQAITEAAQKIQAARV